jgi:hypothetical protein
MDNYQLVGHHVRIIWRDITPKPSNQVGGTIFRGQVASADANGLWLWGRFFIEKADTRSVREMPREKDGEIRMYYGPWLSIDSIQIIPENTKEFEIHQTILTRKPDQANIAGNSVAGVTTGSALQPEGQ